MFYFIAGLVIGFVVGFLVYRNNAKNLRESEAKAKVSIVDLQAELSKLKAVPGVVNNVINKVEEVTRKV